MYFFFVLFSLLLDCAARLSHASPSIFSPFLPIDVFWFFPGKSGSKEPLVACSEWLCLRDTGKSRSSVHLDRIAPVFALANGPTVQTTYSSLSSFAQDRSHGRHCLAAPLSATNFSSPWRSSVRVQFFVLC